MTWRDLAFALLGVSGGGVLGIIVGLSLGFQLGTKRTVILFLKYFPTLQTMNQLVKTLFTIAEKMSQHEAEPHTKDPGNG